MPNPNRVDLDQCDRILAAWDVALVEGRTRRYMVIAVPHGDMRGAKELQEDFARKVLPQSKVEQ